MVNFSKDFPPVRFCPSFSGPVVSGPAFSASLVIANKWPNKWCVLCTLRKIDWTNGPTDGRTDKGTDITVQFSTGIELSGENAAECRPRGGIVDKRDVIFVKFVSRHFTTRHNWIISSRFVLLKCLLTDWVGLLVVNLYLWLLIADTVAYYCAAAHSCAMWAMVNCEINHYYSIDGTVPCSVYLFSLVHCAQTVEDIDTVSFVSTATCLYYDRVKIWQTSVYHFSPVCV